VQRACLVPRLWQADDLPTIEARAASLAELAGLDEERLSAGAVRLRQ
jgi:hypothetical protein